LPPWLAAGVTPPYLQPFVLDVPPVDRVRLGTVDVYAPDAGPRPAVVFVHGGPVPADLRPTPRDWPVYTGYGALAAGAGLVGVTVDHRLHSPADYPTAALDVAAAVEQVRALPAVDADRVALWFFSGGGLLSAPWLAAPPVWLRCIALTYPYLVPGEGWAVDPRFRPVEAVAGSTLPLLVTRVGLERPAVAAGVAAFLAAAPAAPAATVVDVPHGQHAFDMLDHTDESRTAVRAALSWLTTHLTT
jgi:acetyl esterase/lipase